jgi:hypothetical protein
MKDLLDTLMREKKEQERRLTNQLIYVQGGLASLQELKNRQSKKVEKKKDK